MHGKAHAISLKGVFCTIPVCVPLLPAAWPWPPGPAQVVAGTTAWHAAEMWFQPVMLEACWSVLCAPTVLGGADSVGLPSAAEGRALKVSKHRQLRLTSINKSHSWLVIWPKVEVNRENKYSWCWLCIMTMLYKVTTKTAVVDREPLLPDR